MSKIINKLNHLYESDFNRLIGLYEAGNFHQALLILGEKASFLDEFCRKLARNILNIKSDVEFIPELMTVKYDESKAKKEISVDQIRQINKFMQQTATNSNAKIVIIDNVNSLNKNSANALLKILEEPPKNSYFLLICHNIDNVLDTIKSRTISYQLAKLDKNELVNILLSEYPQYTQLQIEQSYELFNGQIENILFYLDNELFEIYQKIENLNIKNITEIEEFIQSQNLKDHFLFNLITKIIYFISYNHLKDITSKQMKDQKQAIKKLDQFIINFTYNLNQLTIFNLDKNNFLRIYLNKLVKIRDY